MTIFHATERCFFAPKNFLTRLTFIELISRNQPSMATVPDLGYVRNSKGYVKFKSYAALNKIYM